MFAHSQSSPMAPPGKTKQTSLDLFSRLSTRTTRRTATEKGTGVAKSSGRQKDTEKRVGPVADHQGDNNNDPPTSQDPQ